MVIDKIEDWEKTPQERGFRRWCIVSTERRDGFLKAAEAADVRLLSTEETPGKYQIWCPPDQDMENFWNEFYKLEKSND